MPSFCILVELSYVSGHSYAIIIHVDSVPTSIVWIIIKEKVRKKMGKTPFAGPHKMISCSGCIILLPQGLGNEFVTWKEAETCQQCPPVMPTFVAQCLLSK